MHSFSLRYCSLSGTYESRELYRPARMKRSRKGIKQQGELHICSVRSLHPLWFDSLNNLEAQITTNPSENSHFCRLGAKYFSYLLRTLTAREKMSPILHVELAFMRVVPFSNRDRYLYKSTKDILLE